MMFAPNKSVTQCGSAHRETGCEHRQGLIEESFRTRRATLSIPLDPQIGQTYAAVSARRAEQDPGAEDPLAA
jgi:hypothetical protein